MVWWPQVRKRWQGALVSLACLTLPYLPLIVWQAPLALKVRQTGFHPYTLNQMVAILLNSWSTGIADWGRPWGPALLGMLAVLELVRQISHSVLDPPRLLSRSLSGVFPSPDLSTRADRVSNVFLSGCEGDPCERPERRLGRDGGLVLLIWLAVPPLVVWLISLRQPLFTDRYLIWSAPAFYLLVAGALNWFASARNASRWAAAMLLGVILVLNGINLWDQGTTPHKSDFRSAATFVAQYREPPSSAVVSGGEEGRQFRCYVPVVIGGQPSFDDLIIFQIPHGRYTFDYYFPVEGYPWAEGLFTNHRAPDGTYVMRAQDAAQHLEEMTKGYDVVWLVVTEVSMWDERDLVRKWLDQNSLHVSGVHFTRVDVYRYVLSDA
jgi:hypothetical protein